MITMQVTQEEYNLIHDTREKEGYYTPIKIGFLNEDMWSFSKTFEFDMLNRLYLFTTTDKEKIINNFPGQFEVYCEKGTKFLCYMNGDEELWSGPDDAFESMSKSWAIKHLTSIELYEQD